MKKKNLHRNGLKLNKRAISSLESGSVTGGATNSCFQYVDTGCAKTVGCNHTNNCPSGACPTNVCPTNGCPPQTANCGTISCQPIGICSAPID
ncbi:hypothetical protein [uncultured Kordia sp.]|uniref:hypothetical protein n=1 Tax=uncultured Kordia sp. TaxID=507699 RepID=UPI00262F8706|nr:hypothetical protein [uncultured Kordia sp.]